MKIDCRKLDLVLARRCMNDADLREGTSPQTLKRIRRGAEVKPKTVDNIAQQLGVDPAEIIETNTRKEARHEHL